jgi:hypothetical protein
LPKSLIQKVKGQGESKADSRVLLDSLDTCVYLANARMLAVLGFRHGYEGVAPAARDKVLNLLEGELQILAQCLHPFYQVNIKRSAVGACERSQSTGRLMDAIT